jgi:hypothetical protein
MDLPGIMVAFLAFGMLVIVASYLPWYAKEDTPKSREPKIPRRVEMRISGGILLFGGIAILIGLAVRSDAGPWTVATRAYQSVVAEIRSFQTGLAIAVLCIGSAAIWFAARRRSAGSEAAETSYLRDLTRNDRIQLIIWLALVAVGIVILLL